eukprot:SAG31_NODE_2170_length_6266_cov_7.557646_2_plen_258_part_00
MGLGERRVIIQVAYATRADTPEITKIKAEIDAIDEALNVMVRNAKKIWDAIDLTHSGFLNRSDARKALQQIGLSFSDAAFEETFKQLCNDDSGGLLRYNAFLKWVQRSETYAHRDEYNAARQRKRDLKTQLDSQSLLQIVKWEDVGKNGNDDWEATPRRSRAEREITHTMPTKGVVKYLFWYAVAWLRVGGVQEYQVRAKLHCEPIATLRSILACAAAAILTVSATVPRTSSTHICVRLERCLDTLQSISSDKMCTT